MTFVFVVLAHRPGVKVLRCLESIKRQRGRFHCVVALDAPDQVTRNAVECSVMMDGRFSIHTRSERVWALKNLADAVAGLPQNSLAAVVDGDDHLLGGQVVQRMLKPFEDSYVDIAWSNYVVNGQPHKRPTTYACGLPDIYDVPWAVCPIRVFRKSAFLRIPKANFLDDTGEWFKRAYDQALFLPLFHVSAGWAFVDDVLYNYDKEEQPPEALAEQKRIAKFIRKRGYVT